MPLLCFVPHLSTGVGTCYAQVQCLPKHAVNTLARLSGVVHLGERRFSHASAELHFWRWNVLYKPGYISRRELLEDAGKDGRVVLTWIANSSFFFRGFDAGYCGRWYGRSTGTCCPFLDNSLRCTAVMCLEWMVYQFITKQQSVIASHVFTLFTQFLVSSTLPPPPLHTHTSTSCCFGEVHIIVILHACREVRVGFRLSAL